ncbi:MAG: epoxide hydrolase 1 [Actinomycetota bacterium]|nr:epoxide hydrolase 1 [Actinomycetota bacterium]
MPRREVLMEVQEFHPHVDGVVLQDLKERLDRTLLPPDIGHGDWSHGTQRQYLVELVDYWKNGFDWREQERRLSRWNHYTVEIRGHQIHFVRAVIGDGAKPLVLTHGWPSSFYELTHLVEPLSDVNADGGYDLVIPSLPGFGFSLAAPEPCRCRRSTSCGRR